MLVRGEKRSLSDLAEIASMSLGTLKAKKDSLVLSVAGKLNHILPHYIMQDKVFTPDFSVTPTAVVIQMQESDIPWHFCYGLPFERYKKLGGSTKTELKVLFGADL